MSSLNLSSTYFFQKWSKPNMKTPWCISMTTHQTPHTMKFGGYYQYSKFGKDMRYSELAE